MPYCCLARFVNLSQAASEYMSTRFILWSSICLVISRLPHAKTDRQCEKPVRIGVVRNGRLDIYPVPISGERRYVMGGERGSPTKLEWLVMDEFAYCGAIVNDQPNGWAKRL
ncbi:hypothetical protein AVEN_178022-1 [Araneus ventricosus]|uniref:Uncharacterized protein n=1 Tax=Araneus ventricosus TaxID=182803 RepID=A0A4Y2MIN2_ARAVE|nr:hypothetical protein AVEN_51872-1 [Araneus ventricosus]GBN27031.1 hypothetical protein AVEN_178022-1 [Araneus ventricosus]